MGLIVKQPLNLPDGRILKDFYLCFRQFHLTNKTNVAIHYDAYINKEARYNNLKPTFSSALNIIMDSSTFSEKNLGDAIYQTLKTQFPNSEDILKDPITDLLIFNQINLKYYCNDVKAVNLWYIQNSGATNEQILAFMVENQMLSPENIDAYKVGEKMFLPISTPDRVEFEFIGICEEGSVITSDPEMKISVSGTYFEARELWNNTTLPSKIIAGQITFTSKVSDKLPVNQPLIINAGTIKVHFLPNS